MTRRGLCVVGLVVCAEGLFVNRTVVVDKDATPNMVIPGSDKGGTSDAFNAIVKHVEWAAKYEVNCDKKGRNGSPKTARDRDKCRQKSKELGCLYRGGNLESWRKCYKQYVPQGKLGAKPKLWMDGTPNYLWGWCRGTDAASRLYELSPRTVGVFLLRDPVSRLRSLFNYWSSGQIGEELGPRLEAHVLSDLEYLAAPVVYEERGHPERREVLSVERLLSEGGRHVYELYMRRYATWAGEALPRERCVEVIGVKQQRRGPWADNAHRAPCPIFANFVLTSVYFPLLKHWIGLFPEQVVVVQSEYYFQDRQTLLALFGYGREPRIDGPPLDSHARKVKNRGHYDVADTSSLTNETAAKLEAFFERPNGDLVALLAGEAARGRIIVSPDPEVAGSWWRPEA